MSDRDKELAALMLQLTGLDLTTADGRAGSGAILREIETKAPGIYRADAGGVGPTPKDAMKLTTVEDLINGGVRVTRSCQWCKDFADVDLQRIAREKGADYVMLDHLPLCTNGDCKGMIRFQAHRGMRTQWLLTQAGLDRFDKHSVWMFETHIIETRRQHLKQRRAPARDSRMD